MSSLNKKLIISILNVLFVTLAHSQGLIGQTEITKWQDGKKGAVSITYDDGSINQFRNAIPIMNRLEIRGTFFIITGLLPGSKYTGKFIGRPISQIIDEAKTIPTNKVNVYERASAARYLGFKGVNGYFDRAGAQIDAGRMEPAFKILDDLYKKVANGELPSENQTIDTANVLTWDMVKTYISQGHEFASHTITHPFLSALDEPNIMYELEQSRQEILDRIGFKYTFSAEVPYGTENDRAMQYAYKIYPALRNRMPEKYLLELDRASRKTSVNPSLEYVQWQRGIVSRTKLPQMKAWTDTTASQNNIWLVLVIHGVDGIGWEPVTSQNVDDCFSYIRSRDKDVWIATFGDVAKYMKERMSSKVSSSQKGRNINIALNHPLDKNLYDLPLTLKTEVNPEWKEAKVEQGESVVKVKVQREGSSTFVTYQAMPGEKNIKISKVK